MESRLLVAARDNKCTLQNNLTCKVVYIKPELSEFEINHFIQNGSDGPAEDFDLNNPFAS